MKNIFVLICLIFIAFTQGCKTQKKDTPEGKNILGYNGGVKKINSGFDTIGKHTTFSKKAIELNNKAILLINNGNETDYMKALDLLNKAINIDSTYYMAYSNKITVLIRLKEYDKAIKTCKYLVTNIKQDYPEAFTILGILYDKLNKKKNAEHYYKKAIKAYTKRINSKEEILDMINKAHLIYIMDNKRGLNEIDSLINAYPSNDELLMYRKHLFTDYNHQEALNEL